MEQAVSRSVGLGVSGRLRNVDDPWCNCTPWVLALHCFSMSRVADLGTTYLEPSLSWLVGGFVRSSLSELHVIRR